MAESAKTGENARWRSRTARAHPIFDICDLILRSNFLKFQILSQLFPLKLFIYNAFIFEASPHPPGSCTSFLLCYIQPEVALYFFSEC